ncbi:MAG: outer membrane beta-barrel protein [Bacteroidales bacterium]|nr:outer membrane beta-barrel protein [Bacteroidales bacterium]
MIKRRHKYESGDKIKDSHRWIIRAGVGVHPGHGWDFAADGTYQGNIVTFYSILKEYITVNARVSKQFKRITLTLEGRDLLDRKRVVQFFSQDMVDSWEEEEDD